MARAQWYGVGTPYARCRRGVTLVEVMAASVIFLMAAMGAFAHFHYARARLSIQSHRRTAAEIAQSRMEELRTVDYRSLRSHKETDQEVLLDNITGFRSTDAVKPFSNCYEVTVTVRWPENRSDQTVQLVTYISRRTKAWNDTIVPGTWEEE